MRAQWELTTCFSRAIILHHFYSVLYQQKGAIMSLEFILRIIGMLLLGIAGGYWGFELAKYNPSEGFRSTASFALVGALAGLVLTPYLTTRPARALKGLLGC